MAQTTIEWCSYTSPDGRFVQGYTWSPWRGCSKVSEGCANCYAEAMSKRNPAVLGEWGKDGKRVVSADWKKPLAWNRAAEKAGVRRRVFPSLCDPFEDREDLIKPLAQFLGLIDDTPSLDWLVLTKRPENFRKRLRAAIGTMPRRGSHGPFTGRRWNAVDWLQGGEPSGRCHPPNVWLGTSAENQETADERIPHLLQIPAAVRWLSLEPLLGPVDLARTIPWRFGADKSSYFGGVTSLESCGKEYPAKRVNWVVIGGESGPNARPCDLAWIRSIVEQCRHAGVSCFVKQLGSRPFGHNLFPQLRMGGYLELIHPKGGDPDEWPEDLRVREMPQ